jgi:glyoxylase-like metal-dependent hydrolase (beta-lactamase superfamily II)
MKLRTLFAFALGCVAGSCTTEAAEPYPFSFETVKVADGIYAFVEAPGKAIVSGNTTVVIGEDGVLVVDTGHHPELSRRMTEEIRRLTPKPVKYVVNTHWHADHVGGNSIFAEAFPEARFIAHAFTAQVLDTEVRPYFGKPCEELSRNQTQRFREMLAKGIGADGKPIPADRRERLEAALKLAAVARDECKEFRYRGADLAFGERVNVRLGGRSVDILWLGRANTAGDAVVYVPDAKVAVTGDILVHPFPFAVHSYISEWAAVLRRIEAMDTVAIVPGHGLVMCDKRYVADLAELMESLMSQARAAYRPGITLEELRGKVDPRCVSDAHRGGQRLHRGELQRDDQGLGARARLPGARREIRARGDAERLVDDGRDRQGEEARRCPPVRRSAPAWRFPRRRRARREPSSARARGWWLNPRASG